MFKSVFTKYITAFMLIILVSFTVLATIIASMVQEYSVDLKVENITRTAESAAAYIRKDFTDSELTFTDFVNMERFDLRDTLYLSIYDKDDTKIVITDNAGKVIFTSPFIDNSFFNKSVPFDVYEEIYNSENHAKISTLGSIFQQKNLVTVLPLNLTQGSIDGYIYVCSTSTNLKDFIDVMIKTVVMSTLWVMLAVLIAVYFITERIIGPIKSMSRAAKLFASGKFDARVTVTGHDEVAELCDAFNQMADSLNKVENTRRTFLANVSHDLRTPMTTISGFIDGILDGAIPPDKHEYYLGIIASEIRRLSRLVSTLLDISRIQAGEREFNKTVFDICEMARQIIISFEQKIENKKLNVEFDTDSDKMLAYADKDAIYQILYNICDNAVKFSNDGGLYRISVKEKEKKICVSVYNEGIGIPEEDVPFVFDRFYKADKSRGLDKTGVGLGLYIAKTIIDSHGEKIWVKSEYGKYCEFSFTLQLSR